MNMNNNNNNKDILKYSLILMGQYNSTLELDFDYHMWIRQEAPNAWTKYPPKNEEYYNGKRFCKISRGYYPQFTKGYLWGRYEDLDYYKDWVFNEDEEMIERSF